MIIPCNPCKPHAFQDAEYGAGNRVHNLRKKDSKVLGWRCTVCGSTKDAKQSDS